MRAIAEAAIGLGMRALVACAFIALLAWWMVSQGLAEW